MNPEVVFVNRPAVNFHTFLGLAYQGMGYSPSASCDSCRRVLSDSEHFLSCLAALKDRAVPVGLEPRLLSHVSFSVFVVADEQDMLDILERCAGMPFVVEETTVRRVQCAVLTGTLAQWRDAVKNGSRRDVERNVRYCFNRIRGLFVSENVNVWTDCRERTALDETFYLE